MSDATAGTPAAPAAAPTDLQAPPAPAQPTPAAPPVDPRAALELTAPAAAEPPSTAPAAEQTFTYTASGDPGLDLALDFVGNLGFGPEHPAIVAAESGDFGPLKEALKAKGDKAKGWEKVMAAGEAAFARIDASNKEKAEKAVAAIHEVAGGAEQWAKIREWAGTAADPDERTAVTAALRAGGVVARAVARELTALYLKQPNAEKAGAPVRSPAAPASTPVGADALSPRAYTAEVAKLKNQLGSRMEGSREYAALQARRSAWRA